MTPWGALEGDGEYGVGWWGCASAGCSGLSLPLRAFFCSFKVSEDFFLISCRARLYSVQGMREERYDECLCGAAAESPNPNTGPTFRVVLVQLVN